MKPWSILLAALSLGPTAAYAQTNTWGADWAMSSLNADVRDSMLGVGRGVHEKPKNSPRAAHGSAGARGAAHPPSFSYVSTAASQRRAGDALMSRVSRTNPQAAREVKAEMDRHDFFSIYDNLVKSTPFRANDASDVLASYLAFGYAISHGTDTTTAQERALRVQVAGSMGSSPAFSAARRTQTADELKLLFVTLHGGFQGAQRQGRQQQYAQRTAEMFAANRIDFTALRLTDRGLVAR